MSNLQKCSEHLDKCLQYFDKVEISNQTVEINTIRHLTKFHLQQWAVKSQLDKHLEALEHGKSSVKNCQALIYRTYKLWK